MTKSILITFAGEIVNRKMEIIRDETRPNEVPDFQEINKTIDIICNVAKQFNPHFNEEKFRAACDL